MGRLRHSQDGASAVMLAFSLFLLIGASAIAVDIAAIWLDRSVDQKVTDSAAAAAVIAAIEDGPQEACEAALTYVAVNSDEIGAIDTTPCSTGPDAFATSCVPGSVDELTVTSGRFDITVTHPVADADPLMTSGIIGGTPQPLHLDDGTECERFAVEMQSTRDSLFAQVLGFNAGTTTVHTVATATEGDNEPPINLLVLDRHGCEAIKVRGGGGIIVEAVADTDSSGNPIGVAQGIAAADSDGSAGCSTAGVIAVEGTTSTLQADGPQNCGYGLGSTYNVSGFTAEEGCGLVQTYAPGTPGCAGGGANLPACSPGGGGSNPPDPVATRLNKPYTREKVDHRWNCYDDYDWSLGAPTGVSWATAALTAANEQDIEDCEEYDGTNDYIYQLIDAIGDVGDTPSASYGPWTYWQADNGWPCTLNPGIPYTWTGNMVIDCADFAVKDNVTINGSVVFNGNVAVTSGTGNFRVNKTVADPGFVFFRDGTLVKDAKAKLTFNYTMVYMSKTSQVTLSGGTGSLTWVAPDTGLDSQFDDLALWSDSTLDHNWAGQSGLVMEGVFFMPMAKAFYSGSSSQNQTDAQWIADKLEAAGNAVLRVTPAIGRSVSFEGVRTVLIR